jgi:hypothetical protein
MIVIIFLYFAVVFVLLNLIVQVLLYLKDAKERLSLKLSLSRQIGPPKNANAKLTESQEILQ